jgi:transcriptional regulator with XRE-family HTH domain
MSKSSPPTNSRTPRPGLRRARKERGWGREKAVERIERKFEEYRSTATGDAIPAGLLGVDVRQLARWEDGETTPRPLHVWLLSQTYGRTPEELNLPSLDPVEEAIDRNEALYGVPHDASPGSMRAVERRDFLRRATGMGLLAISSDDLSRALTGTAHESRAHVARAELSNVGPAALDQLDSDVARLSQALVSKPILSVCLELIETRDAVYALLQGRQLPRQTTDLYVIAGKVCGLLANVCLDLGYNIAADEHARAAYAYGEITGHGALSAFGRATQSLIAYWTGAYHDAVTLAQSGRGITDSPNVRARLMALEARALAKLGRSDQVSVLIREATDAIERADAWIAPGGHLEFTPAKLHYYATNALVDVECNSDAIAHGEQSIRLYRATPSHVRSYGDEAGCNVALADVFVRQGAIDRAADWLGPVLAHPHTGSVPLLRNMLGGLRRQLASPALRGAEGRDLVDRIDNF